MKRWWSGGTARDGGAGPSARPLTRPAGDRLGWWIEALLWIVLAIQLARLFWAIVTPLSPLGEWRGRQPAIPPPAARQALFASMDPFNRDAAVAPTGPSAGQVTSLALQLFGIRLNEASGLGSAIIQTPDGVQSSFAVGDEIVPGARLKAVAFDHVVIDRGGNAESLFIDQSTPAEAVAPAPGTPAATAVPAPAPPPAPVPSTPAAAGAPVVASRLLAGVSLLPRKVKGAVTGIAIAPVGQGDDLQRAGLRPGDVITQINGRPVSSAADVQSLSSGVKPGARLSLMVERGSQTLPVALILENKP